MAKNTNLYQSFVFESYQFNRLKRELSLCYSYDSKLFFAEQITFDFDFSKAYSEAALDQALFGLFIMSGISYYKAYLAPEIVVKPRSLSADQAEFFNKVYLMGLGEFLYTNELEPSLIAKFSASDTRTDKPVEITGLEGSLLPIGGGTDSLLAAEILKSQSESFVSWRVNANQWVSKLMARIGQPQLTVRRLISPKLIELNQQGALNGHVPISAILSFLAVCTAILSGKQNIIMANEASADKGNTTYRDIVINHQYSKSLEFEQNLQNYIREYISPSLNYFSLLRPLSELKIMELFTFYCLDEYAGQFCSCNRNFRAESTNSPKWCGECPKCASIFGLMSAFVPKAKLVALFGKNLFADISLRPLFDALLGNSGIKPFECVGDIEEMQVALKLARQTGQWPELADFKLADTNFDYQKLGPHSMPQTFYKILLNFVERA